MHIGPELFLIFARIWSLDDIFQILFQNKAKNLQNLFSFKFSKNIWRILPDQDPGSNLWAIELRSGAEKKVSFAVIDLDIPDCQWEGTPEATDWWSSLTGFSYGHLFLHHYRYPDVPEPTDLFMVSGLDGILQWVMPNHILVQTINESTIEVATRSSDQFRYLYCKSESGIMIGENESGPRVAREIILKEPVRYREGDPYFEQLASFIFKHSNGQKPVVIDYLEKRPYMVFSYYLYEIEKVTEYLLIITDKKEYVLFEKLSEGRDGIGKSTMLLRGDNLVYLKNNNEFAGLTLYW